MERMMCEESEIKSVRGMSERETAYMNTFFKKTKQTKNKWHTLRGQPG